jgi:para-aminobenzoate synthetase / 4-amino-4-deoxychorismate lyase
VARAEGGWLLGERPQAVVAAARPAEVPAVLAAVERAAAAGQWACGFVAYESALGLDAALSAHALPPGLPAALFVIFARRRARRELPRSPPAEGAGAATQRAAHRQASTSEVWVPTLADAAYRDGIAAIRAAIARGDVYQVNYTYRLRVSPPPDPWELFRRLVSPVPPPWAAFLSCGDLAVCSASPELFFRLAGERITCRPMKGTAARGRWSEEDLQAGARLRASAKERAETRSAPRT